MSEIRDYTTKPKETSEEGAAPPPLFEFKVDGVPMQASKPKDALIAQLAPVQSRRTSAGMKVKLALDFLGDCVLEPGRSILEGRLLNNNDPLDAEDVMPILSDMGDFWRDYDAQQKATKRL